MSNDVNNKEKIRVFNFPWHIAHQYELVQIPDTKWDWLIQHRRQYSAFPRNDFAKELGVDWVPHYEKGKYDFALLHLDQQCFEDGIWDRGKGSLFREVSSVVTDIPKIVIMHGTPYYPESFSSDITEENYKERGYTEDQINMSSVLIERFKEAVEDFDVVVFNSRKAQLQWGYAPVGDGDKIEELNHIRYTSSGKSQKAITIWHGMDKDEWYDLPKEPRVVTMISPAGLDMYYDRTFLRAVKEVLAERDIEHCHITVDASFKSWEEYRQFLGRSLIYFNPTRESPMPRSRTEAMYSGCCVLTTPHQDADLFIKDGENGIIIPRNPNTVADVIEALIFDYKKAIEIGQAGKKTAHELFDIDRYRQTWRSVIREVTGK